MLFFSSSSSFCICCTFVSCAIACIMRLTSSGENIPIALESSSRLSLLTSRLPPPRQRNIDTFLQIGRISQTDPVILGITGKHNPLIANHAILRHSTVRCRLQLKFFFHAVCSGLMRFSARPAVVSDPIFKCNPKRHNSFPLFF